ncbi:helix-turn-helix domain-containing protein [Roseibium sp. RP-7]
MATYWKLSVNLAGQRAETKEERFKEAVFALRRNGLTYRQIAGELSISTSSISRILRRKY